MTDIYSSNYNFLFHGQYTFKTELGGFLSMIYLASTLVILIYYIQKFFSPDNFVKTAYFLITKLPTASHLALFAYPSEIQNYTVLYSAVNTYYPVIITTECTDS